MKKQGLLLVLVTLIDLVTVWPFQGPPMRVVDVLIGVALLATLVFGEKPGRPADYFGLGERVRFVGGKMVGADAPTVKALAERQVCGTILGASTMPGLLRVRLDCYHDERHIPPDALAKVNLHFNAFDTNTSLMLHHATIQSD